MTNELRFYLNDTSGRYTRYASAEVRLEINYRTQRCTGDLRERLYWIRNNLQDYPHCANCGQQLTSRNFKKNGRAAYRLYCGMRCAKLSQDYTKSVAKRKLTNLKRYGSNNPCYFENYRKFLKKRYGIEFIEVEK